VEFLRKDHQSGKGRLQFIRHLTLGLTLSRDALKTLASRVTRGRSLLIFFMLRACARGMSLRYIRSMKTDVSKLRDAWLCFQTWNDVA
jgi:hypothetical protein